MVYGPRSYWPSPDDFNRYSAYGTYNPRKEVSGTRFPKTFNASSDFWVGEELPYLLARPTLIRPGMRYIEGRFPNPLLVANAYGRKQGRAGGPCLSELCLPFDGAFL